MLGGTSLADEEGEEEEEEAEEEMDEDGDEEEDGQSNDLAAAFPSYSAPMHTVAAPATPTPTPTPTPIPVTVSTTPMDPAASKRTEIAERRRVSAPALCGEQNS
jgi:hypothetical protein